MSKDLPNENFAIALAICQIMAGNISDTLIRDLHEFTPDKWTNFFIFSKKYNIIPLLYSKLHKSGCFHLIPIEMRKHFVSAYNASSMSTLKCDYEISKLIKQMNSSDIEVILLKGIYARKCIYENPSERMMCDIDILVKEADIQRSLDVMRNFGCKVNEDYNIENLKKFSQHIPVITTPKGFNIELHWTLFPPDSLVEPSIDIYELWEKKEEIAADEVRCYGLNNEHMLVYLCLNIAENRFKQKLLQIFDIYLILLTGKVDWNSLRGIAERWNARKSLYGVLLAVQQLFSFVVDRRVMAQIEDVIENSDDLKEAIVCTALGEIKDVQETKVVDRLGDKSLSESIKYILWTSFSRDKIIFHYGLNSGSKRIGYYRVIRFFSLFKNFGSHVFELYLKNPAKRKEIKLSHQAGLKKIENWLRN